MAAKDSIYKEIDKNFNSMSFCCIKCGSSELTRSNKPTVREKEDDQNGVYQEMTQVNNTKIRGSLYIVAVFECDKCKNRFSITALDMGKV